MRTHDVFGGYVIRVRPIPASPAHVIADALGRQVFDRLVGRIDAELSPFGGSYERRPTWISSSDPKTLSATVVF